MAVVHEIVPGIYTWSEFSNEKQLNFNGYFLVGNGESVLIDPPELKDQGEKELEDLIVKNSNCPLRAILLTNVHHERTSRKLKDKFSIPIWINAKDSDLLDISPDDTFAGGDTIFCGLRVIPFENQKSPGESGFLLEDRKVLIVGDALIGKVPGKVNLLPAEKYADMPKAKNSLRILKNYDFDTLLVGDGESIGRNARQAVLRFLEQ